MQNIEDDRERPIICIVRGYFDRFIFYCCPQKINTSKQEYIGVFELPLLVLVDVPIGGQKNNYL